MRGTDLMPDPAPPLGDPNPNRGPVPVRDQRSRTRAFVSAARRAQIRTGRFGVNAALHQRARRFARHDLATPHWNPLRTAHAALDEMVMVYFEVLSDPMPAEEFLRVERELDELNALWRRIGVADDPSTLHVAPAAPSITSDEPAVFGGLDGRRLTFASEWAPHEDAPGQASWADAAENETVVLRVLRHGDDRPRPWIVVVHGADMGRTWDARMLRVARMHEELGANIVMPVLPHHGPRGGSRTRASFPSDDHVANVHGLTQALWDVRRSLAWVREQEPTTMGLFGFSLGGCLGSLVACTESDLDAVIMGCPAADIVELVRVNTRPTLRAQPRLARMFAEASAAARPVSAVELRPQLPPERIALISAHADRLADPVFQVGRLWHHFGKPELVGIDSGHVSFFLQSGWIDTVNRLFAERGVTV